MDNISKYAGYSEEERALLNTFPYMTDEELNWFKELEFNEAFKLITSIDTVDEEINSLTIDKLNNGYYMDALKESKNYYLKNIKRYGILSGILMPETLAIIINNQKITYMVDNAKELYQSVLLFGIELGIPTIGITSFLMFLISYNAYRNRDIAINSYQRRLDDIKTKTLHK